MPQALIYLMQPSAASSVLHNFATSGHLVFQSDPSLSSILQLIPRIRNNVCSFDHQLHCQASLAQALDDSPGQLVHRCRWLQETRTEVIIVPSPLRQFLSTHEYSTDTGNHVMRATTKIQFLMSCHGQSQRDRIYIRIIPTPRRPETRDGEHSSFTANANHDPT